MSSDITAQEGATAESDTYVHRPDSVAVGGGDSKPEVTGFGSRGRILVSVVALCFPVIPGAVCLVSSLPVIAGLSCLAAILALPALPAFAFGLIVVWSVTAATCGDEQDLRNRPVFATGFLSREPHSRLPMPTAIPES